MTRDWFDRQLARLTVLPGAPADLEEHWTALCDIPPQVLEPAIGHALRTRRWFPVPADLRVDCDAVARQQRPSAVPPTSRLVPITGSIPVVIHNPFGGDPIVVHVTDAYRADCDECDDTGMVAFWCGPEPSTRWPWMYRRACGRHSTHGSHEWAGACPCVATNATIQRRRAAQGVRYGQEPERAA